MPMLHTTQVLDEMRFGQAWRHEAGTTATINLGHMTSLHIDGIDQVRDLLGAVLGAYQALARLESEPELGKVSRSELDTVAISAGADCAAACAVDGHVPPRHTPRVVDQLEATAAAAREILEAPRCGSCSRLAGMPSASCPACPDYSPAPAGTKRDD